MAQDPRGNQVGDSNTSDLKVQQQIAEGMLKKVRGGGEEGGKPPKNADEILVILEQVSSDIGEQLKETKKYIKSVKKFQDDEKKTDKKQEKNSDILNKSMKAVIAGMKKGRDGFGGGVGGGGGGGAAAGGGMGGRNKALAIASGQISGMLGGTGALQNIWKGTVEHEIEFMQNMRAIAFQTQGITGDAEGLQKAWQETGKVVAQTGKNLTMFQRTLVTQLKKGVVSREDELKLTKTSLNLSTMIGSEAGATANLFHEMHVSLGFSNNQMADLSRGAQAVAKSTGVTGDNLIRALEATKSIVNLMRNAGTMSAVASKNILAIQAAAEKMGVGEQSNRLMKALSSTGELFYNTSESTKTLVYMAGANSKMIAKLQKGIIPNSKADLKRFTQGVEDIFKNYGTTIDEVENLSSERLMALNMQLQSSVEIQSGELKRLVGVYKEQSMTYGELTNKLTQDMKNVNLTTEERINLEKRLNAVQMNAGFSFLTAVDEAGKSAKSLPDAIEKATKKLGPELMSELGMAGMGPIQKIQKMALLAANSLKEAGGKDFTSAIQDAISGGDVSKVRELLSDMNAEQQRLGVEAATSLDPLTQIQQHTNEINESIRGLTAPLIAGVLGILTHTGLMALYLGSMAAQTGVFGKIAGGIKGLFSKGAAGVASKVGHGFGGGAASKAVGGAVGAVGGGAAGAVGGAVGGAGAGAAGAIGKPIGMMGKIGEVIKTGVEKLKTFKFADAKKLIGMLLKGAVVIILLTAALLAIATAIILIGKGLLSLTGMTPEDAAETAWAIAKILLSVALIAAAVIASAAGLVLLGKLAVWGWALIGFMLIGIVVLLALTPVIMDLAAAIINMTSQFLKKLPKPADVVKTVKALISILQSVSKIAGAIVLGITTMANFATWAIFAEFLGIVRLAKKGMEAIIPSIKWLVNSLVSLLDAIARGDMPTVASADRAIKNLEAITKVILSLAKAIKTMGEELVPLTQERHPFLFVYGHAITKEINTAIKPLTEVVTAMADFIKAVIVTLSHTFKNSEGVSHNIILAGKVLAAMAGAVSSIFDIFDVMGNKLAPLTKERHPFLFVYGHAITKEMKDAIEPLRTTIPPMADFIKAVIEILKVKFPNEEGVAHNIIVAQKVLEAMAGAVSAIFNVFDVMGNKLVPMTKATGWKILCTHAPAITSQIEAAKGKLWWMVKSMAEFIKEDVVELLSHTFKNSEGVTHNITLAVKVLTAMAEAITKVAEVADVLATKLMPMTQKTGGFLGFFKSDSVTTQIENSKDKFANFFESLSTFFKEGIITPINGLFEDSGEKTVKSIVNLAKLIAVLPDFLTGVGQKMNEIMSGKSNLEKLAGMKESFGEKFRGVSEFIKEGILDPIEGLPAAGEINKSLQKVNILSSVLGKLVGVMEQLGQIMSMMSRTKFEPTKAVEEINNLMDSIGGLGIVGGGIGGASLGEAKTGTAISGPISDAHDRIRAKHTLEKEQGGSGGGDMAQMRAQTLANAETTVSLLGILHEDNIKIISLLTPSAGEGTGPGSTATQNRNPGTLSNYGNWKPSTASRNITKGT